MEVQEITVRSLDDLPQASGATQEFKEAVRELMAGRTNPRIQFNRQSPAVKVLRLAMKLLEDFPEISIETFAWTGVLVAPNSWVRLM